MALKTNGVARRGAGIQFCEDFRELHAALAKRLAIQKHRRHRHYLPALHLVLKYRAVDHGVPDPRIQHRHHIQCLHHIGTALAGERNEGLEVVVAIEGADLLDHRLIDLRRITAGLQQCEHQRGEFMAHGQPRETHPRILSWPPQPERGFQVGVTAWRATEGRFDVATQHLHFDQMGRRLYIGQQFEHFPRRVAVIG